jgi:hypothetical protein
MGQKGLLKPQTETTDASAEAWMNTTIETFDLRPHTPTAGDLCGRCTSNEFPIVARRHYASRWDINVCERCLTQDERAALKGVIDDGLYLSGVR